MRSLLRDGYARGHKGSWARGRTTLGLSRPTATSRAACRSRAPTTWAATFATCRSAKSGARGAARAASRASAPPRPSRGTAGIATTPRHAWAVARGLRTSSSAHREITPFATTAPSSSSASAGASGSFVRRRASGMPFDHGRFAIVEENWPPDGAPRLRRPTTRLLESRDFTQSLPWSPLMTIELQPCASCARHVGSRYDRLPPSAARPRG